MNNLSWASSRLILIAWDEGDYEQEDISYVR